MTIALWPTSGGSPEKFVIRAKAELAVAAAEPADQVAAVGAPRGPGGLLARIELPLVAACLEVPPADLGAGQPGSSGPRRSRPRRSAAWRPPARRGSDAARRPTGALRPPGRRRPWLGALGAVLGHRLLDEEVLVRPPPPASVWSRWPAGGEARTTTSTSSRASSALERPARAGCRSRPPAPSRAARRSRPRASCPSAWLAATSDQVRPMNPEPTTPTRTVMPTAAGCRSKKSMPAVRQSSMNSYRPSSVLWRPGIPAVQPVEPELAPLRPAPRPACRRWRPAPGPGRPAHAARRSAGRRSP